MINVDALAGAYPADLSFPFVAQEVAFLIPMESSNFSFTMMGF